MEIIPKCSDNFWREICMQIMHKIGQYAYKREPIWKKKSTLKDVITFRQEDRKIRREET